MDRSKDFFRWEKNHDRKYRSGSWGGRAWRGQTRPREPKGQFLVRLLAKDEVAWEGQDQLSCFPKAVALKITCHLQVSRFGEPGVQPRSLYL